MRYPGLTFSDDGSQLEITPEFALLWVKYSQNFTVLIPMDKMFNSLYYFNIKKKTMPRHFYSLILGPMTCLGCKDESYNLPLKDLSKQAIDMKCYLYHNLPAKLAETEKQNKRYNRGLLGGDEKGTM